MYKIIEVEGKRYVDTKSVAELWNIKPNTVCQYCKEGKIPGVFKEGEKYWRIPIDATKPLKETQIKKLLFLSLQLKNNSLSEIDWNVIELKQGKLYEAYKQLEFQGYIKKLPDKNSVDDLKIPYLVELTSKGMDSVWLQVKKKKIDWGNFFLGIAPQLLEIGIVLLERNLK